MTNDQSIENHSKRSSGKPLLVAIAVAVLGVLGMLIVDHGSWNKPKVQTAAMAHYSTTGEAARAVGALTAERVDLFRFEPPDEIAPFTRFAWCGMRGIDWDGRLSPSSGGTEEGQLVPAAEALQLAFTAQRGRTVQMGLAVDEGEGAATAGVARAPSRAVCGEAGFHVGGGARVEGAVSTPEQVDVPDVVSRHLLLPALRHRPRHRCDRP